MNDAIVTHVSEPAPLSREEIRRHLEALPLLPIQLISLGRPAVTVEKSWIGPHLNIVVTSEDRRNAASTLLVDWMLEESGSKERCNRLIFGVQRILVEHLRGIIKETEGAQ